jgi:hypothetical protein
MLRRLLFAAAIAIVLFVAVTLLALEGREVVVLRTSDGSGEARETRTWIADEDGHAWIESANPERPFFQHILVHPEVEVVRGGEVLELRAVPLPPEVGHPLIRRMLAEKYGWADVWIGLIADTSQSTAVRLDPR